MASLILVNIGSGNGLLPDGTKPLPESMLINHQLGPVAFTWWQYSLQIPKISIIKNILETTQVKSRPHLLRKNELNTVNKFVTIASLRQIRILFAWNLRSDQSYVTNTGTMFDIKNNAWVTVNNDFWVTSEAICQSSRVKIIGKSPHEWPQNRYSR